MSSQDMTEPAKTALKDGVGYTRLVGLSVEPLIAHKIGPMKPLDSDDGTGIEAIDAGAKGFSEWPYLSIVTMPTRDFNRTALQQIGNKKKICRYTLINCYPI